MPALTASRRLVLVPCAAAAAGAERPRRYRLARLPVNPPPALAPSVGRTTLKRMYD